MWQSLQDLDRVLRGEATQLPELREATIKIPAGGLSVVMVLLALVYGACMGCFAVFNRPGPVDPAVRQLIASTVEVPALFVLTLAVTFPSLYVFNALVGSRLTMPAVLRLLLAALAVNVAVLASLGPITVFFSACTSSYGFMVLLNVLVFAISGGLGMAFLLQTLHRLSVAGRPPAPPRPRQSVEDQQQEPAGAETEEPTEAEIEVPVACEVVEEPGALDRLESHVLGQHVKTVFACWVVVFGLVGAQMGWVLRPFVGSPEYPFEWFRERESNFFEAVLRTLTSLFS